MILKAQATNESSVVDQEIVRVGIWSPDCPLLRLYDEDECCYLLPGLLADSGYCPHYQGSLRVSKDEFSVICNMRE